MPSTTGAVAPSGAATLAPSPGATDTCTGVSTRRASRALASYFGTLRGTRLPEPIWEAAAEMAQRHGLHCTTKALRMDYTRLKKRLPACNQKIRPEPSACLAVVLVNIQQVSASSGVLFTPVAA